MDEVAVVCPLGGNNNDTRGWAIYVGAVTDAGGGTTYPCSSSTSKLMVRVSIVHHHLQDAAPMQMLQSGWYRSCLLLSAYCPRHRVLSIQSSSRSSFFLFFLFLAGHNNSVYLSARHDDVRTMHFATAMTTFTLTSATLALRGYHLHVVLIGFYSSHNIRAIMTLQLRGGSVHRILPLTYSLVPPFVVLPLWLQGDVRVYLVGYIFCIIDCHICRDIFGRIEIMYCRLLYVFGGVLLLKTLVLYIYRLRDTMQYNNYTQSILHTDSPRFHKVSSGNSVVHFNST
jgi:hypothetical protein